MTSEEPQGKRQSGGEEKEAHSEEETIDKKIFIWSKQSNIKGNKIINKDNRALQPEGISPEEILGLLTGR